MTSPQEDHSIKLWRNNSHKAHFLFFERIAPLMGLLRLFQGSERSNNNVHHNRISVKVVRSDVATALKSEKGETLSEDGKMNNVRFVESFFDCWNNSEADFEDFVPFFLSKKSKVVPEDMDSMPIDQFFARKAQFASSFPDVKFSYKSINEEKPSQVIMEGFRMKGTFTGKPFTPFPGVLPAVKATGTLVETDEERVIFFLKKGKINRIEFIAFGTCIGPVGFYEAHGGTLGSMPY